VGRGDEYGEIPSLFRSLVTRIHVKVCNLSILPINRLLVAMSISSPWNIHAPSNKSTTRKTAGPLCPVCLDCVDCQYDNTSGLRWDGTSLSRIERESAAWMAVSTSETVMNAEEGEEGMTEMVSVSDGWTIRNSLVSGVVAGREASLEDRFCV